MVWGRGNACVPERGRGACWSLMIVRLVPAAKGVEMVPKPLPPAEVFSAVATTLAGVLCRFQAPQLPAAGALCSS